MKLLDPKFTPKLARTIAKWQREYGPAIWTAKAMQGTKFVAPPSLPALVHNTWAFEVNTETQVARRLADTETGLGYHALANYYAETLERAACFHLSEKLTNLALRTVMPRYKLTLDMLPGKKLWGFITWATPIGQAEHTPTARMMVDFRSGELEQAPDLPEFSPFEDADFPVVAASWRFEPEANLVWVAFYTEASDTLRLLRKSMELSPKELEKAKRLLEPLTLEREQALPLDTVLGWCDADPRDGPLLEVTAQVNPDEYPAGLQPEVTMRNEAALSLVSDYVRALIASWMIMRWKIAHQEVIPPPQDVIRTVSKQTGKSKETVAREYGTVVSRLGAPIQQRGPREGAKEYKWKVRAIIGPYIRERQYIPAWDTFDEEPRFIEPYIAGPPDAPIRNLDKVFLVEEESERKK